MQVLSYIDTVRSLVMLTPLLLALDAGEFLVFHLEPSFLASGHFIYSYLNVVFLFEQVDLQNCSLLITFSFRSLDRSELVFNHDEPTTLKNVLLTDKNILSAIRRAHRLQKDGGD